MNRRGAAITVLLPALLAGCATQTSRPVPTAASTAASLRGAVTAPETLGFGSAQRIAIGCARSAGLNVETFTACTRDRLVLSPRQQAVVDCALASQASQHFAECAAPKLGITLDRPQIVTADCAIRSGGAKSAFLACTGGVARGDRITPREQAVLDCAARSRDDVTRFTACSAQQIVGPTATREQTIALACAAQTGGNYAAFTTCAGANLFNVRLNPDQTIAIECVVQVGGMPAAAVGCMAVRFLTRELRSCTAKGFGGAHGCFGDDNMLVGRNGWTMREVGQLGSSRAAAAASIRRWEASSGLMRRTRTWWTGTGKFVRDPADFWRSRPVQAERS